jgi:hypothetical protein
VVTVDPMGRGVLVVHLPPRARGQDLRGVGDREGAARPAGTFASGDGTTVVKLTRMVPRGALVAATVERAGGVQAPTSAPLFPSELRGFGETGWSQAALLALQRTPAKPRPSSAHRPRTW